MAFDMSEGRRALLDIPSSESHKTSFAPNPAQLSNDQRLRLYQASIDNLTRLLGENRFTLPTFPEPLSDQQVSQAAAPSFTPTHADLKVYGVHDRFQAAARDVMEYLRMQERAGRIQLDFKNRMIRTPHAMPIGNIDEIISLLTSASTRPSRQGEAQALELIETAQLPRNLIKNAALKKSLGRQLTQQRDSSMRGMETPFLFQREPKQELDDDDDDDGEKGYKLLERSGVERQSRIRRRRATSAQSLRFSPRSRFVYK
jgi:hypothetical protein